MSLTPPVLLTVLLLAFWLVRRSGKLGRYVVVGMSILAGIVLGVVGFLADGPDAFFDAVTWPVAVLIVASLVMIAARTWTAPRSGDAQESPHRVLGFSLAEHLCGLAVLLALLVAIQLGDAPLAALADPSSPPPDVRAPWFLLGWQEIGHYFQPWAAGWLWGGLLFLALLALPMLDREDREADGAVSTAEEGPGRQRVIGLILFVWLVLVLYPLAVGAWLCHGPDGPGEIALAAPSWGESAAWPLSDLLWNHWLAIGAPERWWVRELPGLLLLGLYFVALPLQLPRWKSTRGVFAQTRRQLGGPRYWLAAVLLLLILLPPLKMYARWFFDLGPLIHLPELGLGL